MKKDDATRNNPKPRPAEKLVPVTVAVPAEFHNLMTPLCDDRAITMGELFRFVAEEYAAQQFMNDEGLNGEHEAHLLRGILRMRRRDAARAN